MHVILSQWLLLLAHVSALIPYQKLRKDIRFHVCGIHSASCLRQSQLSPTDETTTNCNTETQEEYDDDEFDYMRKLTEEALYHCGKNRGLEALETLRELCSLRRPFDFSSNRICAYDSVVAKIPGLIPQSVTEMIFNKARSMIDKGWLSINPDSVDGLPSFHLNLISDGKPIVEMSPTTTTELNDFQCALREITELVTPLIYEQLLPKVRSLMKSSEICVGDVFLRRYGTEVLDGKSRNSISAHFDVFSQVTSVIALDNVAQEGTNGLYTTLVTPAEWTLFGKTSNHASLRRFFPLARGDALVHTWDVLHGVDVEPGLDRTSLIIWFTTKQELSASSSSDSVAPWLFNRADLETNPVCQFVLASALESSERSKPSHDGVTSSSSKAMNLRKKSHQLYLQSAARENSFALTRIGSLCEADELDQSTKKEAARILTSLQKKGNFPLTQKPEFLDLNTPMGLAKGFWWEGAIRGNPLAQIALADEIMVEASQRDDSFFWMGEARGEVYLLAAVLFALAAQQGHPNALDSLGRVIQFELATSDEDIQTEENFLNLPTVKVANSALGS